MSHPILDWFSNLGHDVTYSRSKFVVLECVTSGIRLVFFFIERREYTSVDPLYITRWFIKFKETPGIILSVLELILN